MCPTDDLNASADSQKHFWAVPTPIVIRTYLIWLLLMVLIITIAILGAALLKSYGTSRG